jgi:hypothetical protein
MLSPQITYFTVCEAVAELIAAVVALVTLIFGTIEYHKQGVQKRTELFLKMRDRYGDFADLCALLEREGTPKGNQELRSFPYERKFQFVAFHEELALMAESGLIRYRLASYMFGYYAIKCWSSDNFWNDIPGSPMNREEPYWRLFHAFVDRMQKEEEDFRRLKFESKRYQI